MTSMSVAEYNLEMAKTGLKVGAVIEVFDQHVHPKTQVLEYKPHRVKVIDTKYEMKHVYVEFLKSNPWHEAGGHWVYRGQTLKFCYDRHTGMWLREGITPEVVRTYNDQGQTVYFELSYTKQFLVFSGMKLPDNVKI